MIEDFTTAIALLQVRCEMLRFLEFSDWEALPLLQQWQNPQARYSLTIDDYQTLAELLRVELRRVYRERKQCPAREADR